MNIDLWKKQKKMLNMTLDQIAEKSGVSRRTIAGIFSGDPNRPKPTLNTVQAIERALGIEEKAVIERPPYDLMGKKEQNLLKMYKLMTERQQIEYYGIAIGMLQSSGIDTMQFLS